VRRPGREAYDRWSLPGGPVPVTFSAVPPAPADRPGSWLPRSGRRLPRLLSPSECLAGFLALAVAAASEPAVPAESWELAAPAVQAEQPRCRRAARPSFQFLGVLTGTAWVLEGAADPIPVQRPGLGHRREVAGAAERAATAPDSAVSSWTGPDSAAGPAFAAAVPASAASAAAVPASAASVAQPPASAQPGDGSRTHSDARRRVVVDGRRSRETAGWLSHWPRHLERQLHLQVWSLRALPAAACSGRSGS